MGSYSCAEGSLPFLTQADVEAAKHINEATARAISAETGKLYRGVLYGGFMATRRGVRLIEYNARFGDPEAMNVLPILDGDFFELCVAVVQGNVHRASIGFRPMATVCKYVVPKGYPTNPVKDVPILVPQVLHGREDLRVYYAAVNQDQDRTMLTGSRAVAFVGIAPDVATAETLSEEAASSVQGPVFHRSDIGRRSLLEARVTHMTELRGLSHAHAGTS